MAQALEEFTNTLAKAAKELASMEDTKKSVAAETEYMMKKRAECELDLKKFKQLTDEEKASLLAQRRKFEEYLEKSNSELASKSKELKEREQVLVNGQAKLSADQEKLVANRTKFDFDVQQERNSKLTKSEVMKGLLEKLQ